MRAEGRERQSAATLCAFFSFLCHSVPQLYTLCLPVIEERERLRLADLPSRWLMARLLARNNEKKDRYFLFCLP